MNGNGLIVCLTLHLGEIIEQLITPTVRQVAKFLFLFCFAFEDK